MSTEPEFRYKCIEKLMENQEFSEKNKTKDEFMEYIIEFLPSYKWKPNLKEYDLHEGKRIPSWTD